MLHINPHNLSHSNDIHYARFTNQRTKKQFWQIMRTKIISVCYVVKLVVKILNYVNSTIKIFLVLPSCKEYRNSYLVKLISNT